MSSLRMDCPECGEAIDVEFVARGYQGRINVEVEDPWCPECLAELDERQLEVDAVEALV